MRDYDFGNRLTDLRKAKGYSQYQLGTLVGVTDKAVSKWENGTAKPRVSVIMKLAAILGVTMEELLYDSQESSLKDGRELKNLKIELWQEAETRMRTLFGEYPNLAVRNRFAMEKNALGSSDVIVLFKVMSLLKAFADSKHTVFTPRAMTTCSFVAWLLGSTVVNPLPVHYRCPNCRRIVFVPESDCGWDLSEKTCDECSTVMIRDGHDLPFEICACGKSDPLVSMDCNIDKNLIDKAWEIVMDYMSPYYAFLRWDVSFGPDGEIKVPRLFFMKDRVGVTDRIDAVPFVDEKAYYDFCESVPSLLLLPVFCENKHAVPVEDSMQPENLISADRMTVALNGFIDEYRERYEEEKLRAGTEADAIKHRRWLPEKVEKVDSFGRFVTIINAVHVTCKDSGLDELAESFGLSDYTELPLSREAVWHLIHRCAGNAGNLTGIASEIIYKLRMGIYSRRMTEDDLKLFEQLNLPPWFAGFAKDILYLFPRCHDVAIAYQLLQMKD